MLCCVYDYAAVANPEETAFACSIALQCYFEGRTVTKEDMDKCIAFWRENIAEYTDPVNRKRAVCCEVSSLLPDFFMPSLLFSQYQLLTP